LKKSSIQNDLNIYAFTNKKEIEVNEEFREKLDLSEQLEESSSHEDEIQWKPKRKGCLDRNMPNSLWERKIEMLGECRKTKEKALVWDKTKRMKRCG